MFQRALISVSDKRLLKELGQCLHSQGTQLVSTGGSAQELRSAGLSVTDVSELTGFPEVMDGRVKTLHPNVHMALLARKDHAGDQSVLEKFGVLPFDLVVVNLYPFEKALMGKASTQEQIEKIDVGGPSMLRAAAKSFDRITVLSDPDQYQIVLSGKPVDFQQRRALAAKAFAQVSSYDSMVAEFLNPSERGILSVGGSLNSELRYGENPHQKGWWYRKLGSSKGWQAAKILQGKELSYNNLLDLDSAQRCLSDLSGPSCVVVKHNNPCGVAQSDSVFNAVDLALNADPLSCFGGVVAINQEVTVETAKRLGEQFLECVVAPSYSSGALEVLSKKKNQRVLELAKDKWGQHEFRVSSISGGFLAQQTDEVQAWSEDWKVLGTSSLSESLRADLSLAWVVCAHLKSNAISLVSGGVTVGLGMGQVSRVDSVEQALNRMEKYHSSAKSVVAASDAFFPFPDSIEFLASHGVKFVIQPGGSIKDDEVLQRCKDLGVVMVLTGQRHFRH